jgi:hypothetical protein
VALLVSEQSRLFGFMESNYRPAILVAIASETAAALALGLLLLLTLRAKPAVSDPRQLVEDYRQPSTGTTSAQLPSTQRIRFARAKYSRSRL